MSILGSVGSLYMIILILILIIGLGMVGMGFWNFIMQKARATNKIKDYGGKVMQNNGWLKIIGILSRRYYHCSRTIKLYK